MSTKARRVHMPHLKEPEKKSACGRKVSARREVPMTLSADRFDCKACRATVDGMAATGKCNSCGSSDGYRVRYSGISGMSVVKMRLCPACAMKSAALPLLPSKAAYLEALRPKMGRLWQVLE